MWISRFSWLFFLLLISLCSAPLQGFNARATKADVRVILDLETTIGKIFKTCISMAIEDFYSKHGNYSTMIVPHFRDARTDAVASASAAIDLLKNTQLMAIFGPQRSIQADFVIDIGGKVNVPIISPATTPNLSPKASPYFIRSVWCSSSQARAIAAVVKTFGWREVAFIYEDSKYGGGLLPFLTDLLQTSNALVSYQSVVSPSAGDDQILKELYEIKTKQTRVFVVHLGPALASRFFKKAKEAGMISKGYAWIIADSLTSFLDSVDSETIEAMQGVVGVKAYIPRSFELKNFTKRWSKRFHKDNPDMDRTGLNVFGLWAYDSITALAEAIERVGVTSPRFRKPVNRENLTDLEATGTSDTGPSLVGLIRNFRSKGLSGDFHIANGQLQPSVFEIVNVNGKGEKRVGFWTETYGITPKLETDDDIRHLGAIVWPGETTVVPKGWEIPTSGKNEFSKIERNAETNTVELTGFCIDVFKGLLDFMPYDVPCEYSPLQKHELGIEGYNTLVGYVFGEQKYDAVVGYVTITAKRSEYLDFTFPYTESGVAAVVPIKDSERKNAWVFMKPLTTCLWLTVGAFFVFTGFVVWVLEHRINKEFRGPPLQQVGMIFWFSFSTLVFAHREKVISNLTRFVMIVWVFVVLVLTLSYTASLTSMLTVQQLQPTITDMYDLIKNGAYIGYQDGSFVRELLNNMKFDSSKLRSYTSVEEYDEALSKGSRNGGVDAIVDELPYIRIFLSKYCHKYTMIGPTYMTPGFGFAFPKGSPLVADVSRAILKLKEDEKMVRISRTWLKEEKECLSSDGSMITSESLSLDSFKGLFLIAGLSSSSSALAIFLFTFLYEHRYIWTSTAPIKQKLYGLARVFNQEKYYAPSLSSKTQTQIVLAQSPEINSTSCDQQGMLSQDEVFSAASSTQHV
ncbi:hypothetical protein ACS0TY_035553 [Phlomoides rotata]